MWRSAAHCAAARFLRLISNCQDNKRFRLKYLPPPRAAAARAMSGEMRHE